MAGSKLSKRKRCPSCRCLFRPSPRAGSRQRFCSKVECQRERHRRACKRWHAENPDYNRRRRIRDKVAPSGQAGSVVELHGDPLDLLDLEAMQPDVALAVVVVLEEGFRTHREWARAVFTAGGQRGGGANSVRGPP